MLSCIVVEKHSFVLAVRQAVGGSQSQFADRLGVNVRTVKRFEADGTEPTSIAVRRQLEAMAKPFGLTRDPITWRYSPEMQPKRETLEVSK